MTKMCVITEMQRWFKIHKSISKINDINKYRDKNHMIVSKDAFKAFAKIQYAFIITVPWTAGQEGPFLNTIKTTCEKLHYQHHPK